MLADGLTVMHRAGGYTRDLAMARTFKTAEEAAYFAITSRAMVDSRRIIVRHEDDVKALLVARELLNG